MLQQVFTLTVLSTDSVGLDGANIALRECRELIAEHVDSCTLEISAMVPKEV